MNRIPDKYLNKVVVGNSRNLSYGVPDNSIDLIFTDPIYDREDDYLWLGAISRHLLKQDGRLLVWSNGRWHKKNVDWLESCGLVYRWDFAWMHYAGLSPMNGKIICKTQRLIWMDLDGQSKMVDYCPDGFISRPWLKSQLNEPNPEHRWTKSPSFTRIAVRAFSSIGDVVFDPFAGGGTIPAICKELDRNFIAFEIDEKSAEIAKNRLERTQLTLPDFNDAVEQADFGF